MNRLIVAHHDSVFLRRLTNELSKRIRNQGIVIATDSNHLICEQFLCPAHAILLDMALPEIDRVMEFLRNDSSHPLVLALADDKSALTKALQLGAVNCLTRDTPLSLLCDRIETLMLSDKKPAYHLPITNSQHIRELLFELGLSSRLKGSYYLEQALLLIAEKPYLLINLTELLYPAMTKIIRDTAINIDRCLRYVISASWKWMNSEQKTRLYGKNSRKPSVKLFLSALSRLL